MKIALLDAATLGDVPNLGLLSDLGQLVVYQTTRPEQTLARCLGNDIIITNKVKISADIMQASPDLKLICVAATGTNNIDLDQAVKSGILVKNVQNYSTSSVAQHTFASLLYLLNQTGYYDQYVKSGAYSRSETFTHYGPPVYELAGKTIGIIGLGSIGQRVAAIATTFGAEVVYYSASGLTSHPVYRRLDLPELLSASDIVSVHAPLTERTRHLLAYAEISLMKKSAYLLNMGRGGIVCEQSLARALQEELIAGAALDVLEQEPITAGHPLLSISRPERLLITPHMAWASVEARQKLVEKISQNIADFVHSQP